MDELVLSMNKWKNKYKFPNAIGAVDCTHVLIEKPNLYGDEYVNRKGLTSLNIQVICDAEEKITSFDCRWPGSVHDSRIWRNSDVLGIIKYNDAGALLLADEGYGIAPWLMTPFKDAHGELKNSYNCLHSKERIIIERVFGQVKRRFPMLKEKIRVKTERIPSLIAACFILHNIAKYLGEAEFTFEDENLQENREQFFLNDNAGDTDKRRGELRRDQICRFIYNQNSE